MCSISQVLHSYLYQYWIVLQSYVEHLKIICNHIKEPTLHFGYRAFIQAFWSILQVDQSPFRMHIEHGIRFPSPTKVIIPVFSQIWESQQYRTPVWWTLNMVWSCDLGTGKGLKIKNHVFSPETGFYLTKYLLGSIKWLIEIKKIIGRN